MSEWIVCEGRWISKTVAKPSLEPDDELRARMPTSYDANEQPSNGIKKLRWWICTLLFLATLVNYLDRQAFAVATPAIVEEFGLSNDDVANINIAFTSAYMVGQMLTGRLIDVLGTRLGFLLIMLFWPASGILCSTARVVFQGNLIDPANRLIRSWNCAFRRYEIRQRKERSAAIEWLWFPIPA